MAKISIIIPVYNVEKYLDRCLESIINQTMKDIEIICIDDASTDCSQNILKEYANKDKRIKGIYLEKNAGTLEARKEGIRQATGEYVMFVDSDDYIEYTTCEEILKIMKEHQVDVLHFGTQVHANENVSENLKEWVVRFLIPYEGIIKEENLIKKSFVEEIFDFNIWNKLWSREVVYKAFEISENKHLVTSEDRYLFFLLMYYSKSYYGIRNKFYHYNIGIGITGGDILSLEQFEKRCSGVRAVELVDHFLIKIGEEKKLSYERDEFAKKIIWDCVDCWYNKLKEDDLRKGLVILQKYFKAEEIASAVGGLYYQKANEMLQVARIQSEKNLGIYCRRLGSRRMEAVVDKYIRQFQRLGLNVILYTDCDRKKYIKGKHYEKKVYYVPNIIPADRTSYELRANIFLNQLKKNETKILIYMLPVSYTFSTDCLLATLAGVKVIDEYNETYKDMVREKVKRYCKKIYIRLKRKVNRK